MSKAGSFSTWVRRRRRLSMVLFLLLASPAEATQGNVFAKGVVYQAATYVGHPKYGTHPSYYGNSPEQVADINIGEDSGDDEGTPLFAPEDGAVTIIHNNTDSWGYSIEWRNAAGTERLFLAHLKCIITVGSVQAGEKIGEIGGTGGWNPHLHIESAAGWVVLSGRELRPPVNPHGNGMLYVSNGPADQRSFSANSSAEFLTAEPSESYREIIGLGGGGKAAPLPDRSQINKAAYPAQQ